MFWLSSNIKNYKIGGGTGAVHCEETTAKKLNNFLDQCKTGKG
jgi:hypothetical protein